MKRTCQQCCTPFTTPAWRVRQGKGRYCSRQCYELARRVPDGLEHDGKWFARNGTNRYYWHKTPGKRSISLHRYVWRQHHGAIAPNHAIHHIDGNPANNDISNLALLPRGQHQSEHVRLRSRNVLGQWTT